MSLKRSEVDPPFSLKDIIDMSFLVFNFWWSFGLVAEANASVWEEATQPLSLPLKATKHRFMNQFIRQSKAPRHKQKQRHSDTFRC